MRHVRAILLFACIVAFGVSLSAAAEPAHFAFFNRDRDRIHGPVFLEHPGLVGAQLTYGWRELEPEEGRYDFSAIEADLAVLNAHGKRLSIQVQEHSFSPEINNAPRYLLNDPRFNGGAHLVPEDESPGAPMRWLVRRWDPAVNDRFNALLLALGATFDGRIEGVTLSETGIGIADDPALWPPEFTHDGYCGEIIRTVDVLGRAFTKSVSILYTNFMTGEWLPDDDHGRLQQVVTAARAAGVGVGGPDLLPYKPGQMNHAYPLIRASAGIVPTGVAVQWNNYRHINPRTGVQVTVEEIHAFATDHQRLDYLLWCDQEPFYSERVLPFLRSRAVDSVR